MLYSVIYSVDVTEDTPMGPWVPSEDGQGWEQTEDDEEYEYEEEFGPGHHAKWAACLTQEQFDDFVEQMDLKAQDVETGGSMGGIMPDGEVYLGALPAISFDSDSPHPIYCNAYVTPIPQVKQTWRGRSEESQERVFQRIRKAVLNKYG